MRWQWAGSGVGGVSRKKNAVCDLKQKNKKKKLVTKTEGNCSIATIWNFRKSHLHLPYSRLSFVDEILCKLVDDEGNANGTIKPAIPPNWNNHIHTPKHTHTTTPRTQRWMLALMQCYSFIAIYSYEHCTNRDILPVSSESNCGMNNNMRWVGNTKKIRFTIENSTMNLFDCPKERNFFHKSIRLSISMPEMPSFSNGIPIRWT